MAYNSSIIDDEAECQTDQENGSMFDNSGNIISDKTPRLLQNSPDNIALHLPLNTSKAESKTSVLSDYMSPHGGLQNNSWKLSSSCNHHPAELTTHQATSSDLTKLSCSSKGTVRWNRGSPGGLAKIKRMAVLSVCFLSVFSINVAQGKIRSRDPGDPVGNIRHVLPELEWGNNSVTDVRFNVGSTAFLPCRFPSFPRHHENRVSWVRRWDWHILTAGLFTYTNDDRFVVLHRDGTNDWTLQIKFLDTQDNGTYECQVHSGSGFMSQFVNLHVVTPKAVILESKELTVKNGDNFALTCIIQQSLEPPVYVIWLHGGVTVNYAADRPRLTVQMEAKGSTTRSLLRVRDAKYTDSGNYTCTAPNAINAWVLVYVTEGDTVAAVQRRHPDASGAASSSSSSATAGSASSSAVSSSSSSSSSPTLASGASSLTGGHHGHRKLLTHAVLGILLQLLFLQALNTSSVPYSDNCEHSIKTHSNRNINSQNESIHRETNTFQIYPRCIKENSRCGGHNTSGNPIMR